MISTIKRGMTDCPGEPHQEMALAFQKVYTVSSKNDPETPRVWLQSLVCKQAGFIKGEKLYVSINESAKEIIIQSEPITDQDTLVSVNGRKVKNGESPFVEPLLDTASNR
jgi:DNA (cytosine-5)-methyltransferase 1